MSSVFIKVYKRNLDAKSDVYKRKILQKMWGKPMHQPETALNHQKPGEMYENRSQP